MSEINIGPIKSSTKELIDLAKAWVILSLAFAIIDNGGFSPLSKLLVYMVKAALTVGIAFIFHEMAHKVLAQKYGCRAEFRSFDQMLLLALLMSFFGFLFAAPGAVMIRGRVTPKQDGMISAAGCVMNLFLAGVFLLNMLLIPLSPESFLYSFLSMGLYINALLALFNLIPIGFFDGKKILDWNKWVYGLMALAGGLLIVASTLLGSSL